MDPMKTPRFLSRSTVAYAAAAVTLAGIPAMAQKGDGNSGVKLEVDEAARRVDVTIDGKPFTSYIWPTAIKKPVLYPIRTAEGTVVTRGFLAPIARIVAARRARDGLERMLIGVKGKLEK